MLNRATVIAAAVALSLCAGAPAAHAQYPYGNKTVITNSGNGIGNRIVVNNGGNHGLYGQHAQYAQYAQPYYGQTSGYPSYATDPYYARPVYYAGGAWRGSAIPGGQYADYGNLGYNQGYGGYDNYAYQSYSNYGYQGGLGYASAPVYYGNHGGFNGVGGRGLVGVNVINNSGNGVGNRIRVGGGGGSLLNFNIIRNSGNGTGNVIRIR